MRRRVTAGARVRKENTRASESPGKALKWNQSTITTKGLELGGQQATKLPNQALPEGSGEPELGVGAALSRPRLDLCKAATLAPL